VCDTLNLVCIASLLPGGFEHGVAIKWDGHVRG